MTFAPDPMKDKENDQIKFMEYASKMNKELTERYEAAKQYLTFNQRKGGREMTPEEILSKNKVSERHFRFINKGYILKSMQEYADQEKRKAFNEALDLAAKNAVVKITDGHQDLRKYKEYIVDKQSILKLKV